MTDVYEVQLSLMEMEGIALDTVTHVAEQKRQSRGGFRQRIWMSNYRTPVEVDAGITIRTRRVTVSRQSLSLLWPPSANDMGPLSAAARPCSR